jgi:hypothetical protein
LATEEGDDQGQILGSFLTLYTFQKDVSIKNEGAEKTGGAEKAEEAALT